MLIMNFLNARNTVSMNSKLILGQLSSLKRCDSDEPWYAKWTQCSTQLQEVYSYMAQSILIRFHQMCNNIKPRLILYDV